MEEEEGPKPSAEVVKTVPSLSLSVPLTCARFIHRREHRP